MCVIGVTNVIHGFLFLCYKKQTGGYFPKTDADYYIWVGYHQIEGKPIETI